MSVISPLKINISSTLVRGGEVGVVKLRNLRKFITTDTYRNINHLLHQN